MSTRQLLAATSFGVYATGQRFESRPNHTLEGTLLTIFFETNTEFIEYIRRAFRVTASRLVAFTAESVGDRLVRCRAIFNHTPYLKVVGSVNDPSGDDSDVSVFSIRRQRNCTVSI